MKLITIVFCIFAGLFVISGVFALLGAALGLTFGILGAIMSIVWRIIFSPIGLVVLTVWLVLRFRAKPSSR